LSQYFGAKDKGYLQSVRLERAILDYLSEQKSGNSLVFRGSFKKIELFFYFREYFFQIIFIFASLFNAIFVDIF